ncbi:hypothetical protein FHT00_000884 [Sphingomonas insulae]|uniref:Endonuclease/Exonuclease/phosphatase family protein n=1 Tax=Sphingomonas insulae TaxID=424800 RepID=A0ABN1HSR5_9SPHN|nr:endonuclease/exonuclease/phosphatase family protein [Sphingomonas insulae]NIJ28951.1 hypothetical protein [Sphingomonas insulae]
MASTVPINNCAYCLTTWNSQGSLKRQEKQDILKGLPMPAKTNILFLQEAGAEPVALAGYSSFTGDQVGSFAGRCTCQLLVPVPATPVMLVTKDKAAFVTGGVAGRTCAAAMLGDTLLISMHTTANDTAADTIALVALLNTNPDYAKCRLIVIGADFNIEPDSLQASLAAQAITRTATLWPFAAAIWRTGQKTQGGAGKDKRELDYFVVLTPRNPAVDFRAGQPSVKAVDCSDHNPVQMVCDLPPPRASAPTAARQTAARSADVTPADRPGPRTLRRPG